MCIYRSKWIVITAYLLILFSTIIFTERVIGTKVIEVCLNIHASEDLEYYHDNKGNVVTFERINDKTTIYTIQEKEPIVIDHSYDFSRQCAGLIYLFKGVDDPTGDKFLKTLEITVYSAAKHEIIAKTCFNISNSDKSDIAVLKGGYVCVVSSNIRKNIFLCRCSSGKVTSHRFTKGIESIDANSDGTLMYIRFEGEDSISVVDNNLNPLTEIPVSFKGLARFLDDDVIMDHDGNIYINKTKGEFDYVPFVNINNSGKNMCVVGSFIVYNTSDNEISFLDMLSAEEYVGLKVDGNIKYISEYKGSVLYVIEREGELFSRKINPDDAVNAITKSLNAEKTVLDTVQDSSKLNIRKEKLESEKAEFSIPKGKCNLRKKLNFNKGKNEIATYSYKFRSDTYLIDFARKYIKGIDFGTTITGFKENVDLDGHDITFQKKGKLIKSGKIGTNTLIRLKSDDSGESEFIAIVNGDLTGSGNVNLMDMREMYRHIFHEKNLEDVYFEAADLNADGVVDTLDLLLLSKIINK